MTAVDGANWQVWRSHRTARFGWGSSGRRRAWRGGRRRRGAFCGSSRPGRRAASCHRTIWRTCMSGWVRRIGRWSVWSGRWRSGRVAVYGIKGSFLFAGLQSDPGFRGCPAAADRLTRHSPRKSVIPGTCRGTADALPDSERVPRAQSEPPARALGVDLPETRRQHVLDTPPVLHIVARSSASRRPCWPRARCRSRPRGPGRRAAGCSRA